MQLFAQLLAQQVLFPQTYTCFFDSLLSFFDSLLLLPSEIHAGFWTGTLGTDYFVENQIHSKA